MKYQYYPQSTQIPEHLNSIILEFEANFDKFDSENHNLKSDEVLEILSTNFETIGYRVERGKKDEQKIKIPVLFGENGKIEKYFEADAYNYETKTVIEIEAGRGYLNNQFLKDLFQACMMQDTKHLVIAVRQIYLEKNKDYEKIKIFFDTLYASKRLTLPLEGILLIGY